MSSHCFELHHFSVSKEKYNFHRRYQLFQCYTCCRQENLLDDIGEEWIMQEEFIKRDWYHEKNKTRYVFLLE